MVSTAALAGVAVLAVGGIAAYYYVSQASTGGISITVLNPSIASGATETITVTGVTPSGSAQVEVITNTGVGLILSPNATASAGGVFNYAFTVGSNIPPGQNTIKVTDLTTQKSQTATFTVT